MNDNVRAQTSPPTLRDQFARDFAALDELPPIQFQMSAISAWCLMSQIQLAYRHPANTGPSRDVAETVARQLQDYLAITPALSAVAEHGWLLDADPDRQAIGPIPIDDLVELADRLGARGVWLLRGAICPDLLYNLPGQRGNDIPLCLSLKDADLIVIARFPAGDGGQPGLEFRGEDEREQISQGGG